MASVVNPTVCRVVVHTAGALEDVVWLSSQGTTGQMRGCTGDMVKD